MKTNPLHALRAWLTPAEAAGHLSGQLNAEISTADVLLLALDGRLRLSVRLPSATKVRWYRYAHDQHPIESRAVEGLWHLLMEGAGRRQVEHDLHRLNGLPYISMEGRIGADLYRGYERCRLEPEPGMTGLSPRAASALTYGVTIVVQTQDLADFLATLKNEPDRELDTKPTSSQIAPPPDPEKPLQTRERRTLSLIIAALAQEADIDLSKASKAGETVSALLALMGHTVAPNTIARHLRAARAAGTGESASDADEP